MAVRCRPSKPAYPLVTSVDVPVLVSVHPSLLEPWSKARIQRVSVVLCTESEVYMGYDEGVERVLSDVDRVINACPSLLPYTSNTSTLLVPKTYDRTLLDIKEEETYSKDSFLMEDKPQEASTTLADTQTTLGNQENLPNPIDDKSPFEILADFNRKSPTKKLENFNRPMLKQGHTGVAVKSDLVLSLPSADSLLKQLSELRTERIAEQRLINRLERCLDGEITPESSEMPTDH